MPPSGEPSDFELQILGLLWERGTMSARQVLENLPDGKPRAYTSVLSVMQVMEKKGLLNHRTQGNVNFYRAKVTKSRVLGGVLGKLVKHVFGGNPAAAVQCLLQDHPVSDKELLEIRRVLEAHRKEKDTENQP